MPHEQPSHQTFDTSASSVTEQHTTRQKAIRKRGLLVAAIAAAILLIGSGIYFLSTRNQAESDALSYRSCNFSAKNQIKKRVVNGFFFFTSSDQCTNRKQLSQARQVGAATAITFGARMKPASRGDLARGDYRNFRIGNQPAFNHIARQTDGGSIRKIFTYNNKEIYSKNALNCGKRNGVIVRDNKMFTWWLFPVNSSFSACSDSKKQYDLVVSYNQNARSDGNDNMIVNAKKLGITVYLGLPNPNTDTKTPYVASGNDGDRHTLGSFTTRVLRSWSQRYGNNSAFNGVYLTLESMIGGKPHIWGNNYRVYGVQSQIVGWNLPGSKRNIIVSPYTNGNLNGAAASMRTMVNAARQGSGTRVTMMPQDGVGTGRLGNLSKAKTLYSEAQKSGSNRVWANLEAFRPGGAPGNRNPMPSDGKRFKSQISYARQGGAAWIITYDWSTFSKSGAARHF